MLDALILEEDLISDNHTLVGNLERFSLALLQEACMVEAVSSSLHEEENDDFLITVTINKKGALKLVATLHQLVRQIRKAPQD